LREELAQFIHHLDEHLEGDQRAPFDQPMQLEVTLVADGLSLLGLRTER
jgi:hypothetical protein